MAYVLVMKHLRLGMFLYIEPVSRLIINGAHNADWMRLQYALGFLHYDGVHGLPR
jgi:hypothetical protein